MAGQQSQLEALIAPIVESLDYCCWGIELISHRSHSMLRVYIDAPSGITIDDCEKVSRQLSAVMDVEDPLSGKYTLEVSSPGLGRPLFRIEQYQMMAGYLVDLRLRFPFEGRRKYRGIIKGVEEHHVVIEADEHELLFPIESIEKAQMVPQFE